MASAIVINGAAVTNPWMVMVHGMSQDHRVFSAQIEAFKDHFRLLLVDLPGHGLSSAVGGPFGHLEMADHVRAALAANEAENVIYWGTHTGATVGLYLGATCPGLISALILEGPLVPGANPQIVVETIDRAKATAQSKGIAEAIEEWWREGCWFAYMHANPEACRAAAHLEIIRDFTGAPWLDDQAPKPVKNAEELLSGITVPALIYNGAGDHPDFLDAADRIHTLLGQSRKAVIAEAGGFPAWETPVAVNALVADFLDPAGDTSAET